MVKSVLLNINHGPMYSNENYNMKQTKTLSMKNRKEELFNAYFEASDEMKQMKEEQKILIVICSVLFIFTMI